MRSEGIDLLLIGPSSDLFYLIGFDAHISERLNLLGLPLEGRPFLVLPLLEAPNAASVKDLVDIHAWGETVSPTALAGRLAGDMTGKVAAVSDQLWSGFLLKLQNEIEGATWQSALPVMKPLRLTKDENEIESAGESRPPDRSRVARVHRGHHAHRFDRNPGIAATDYAD